MARILVADDDDDIRLLVMLRLQHCGHEVEGVGDGRAAVVRAESGDFDLVVLDLMMPELDGLEACRAIREKSSLHDLPVILLTARAQAADLEAGLAAGANAYITKPFSPRDLSARVDKLLVASA